MLARACVMDSGGDFAEALPDPDPCLLDASVVYFTHCCQQRRLFSKSDSGGQTAGTCATEINKACRCPLIPSQPIHSLTFSQTLALTSLSPSLLCVHNCSWLLKTMNRRTFEGPMDWEYQNQPPVDFSSPFAKLSQAQQGGMFSVP